METKSYQRYNVKRMISKFTDSGLLMCMLLMAALFETAIIKMIDSQNLIKYFSEPDKSFSFPITERNFVFPWAKTFPGFSYSRWKDCDYCLQLVLFCAFCPGKNLTKFFDGDQIQAFKSLRNY